jgi:hypothetical protein
VNRCKRASSGGKTPKEAVKSEAVHGRSFHNGNNIPRFREKIKQKTGCFFENKYIFFCLTQSFSLIFC